ncbi:MAG: hypothetical protein ACLFQV_09520 [Vulcanimicrobiota bacterium]
MTELLSSQYALIVRIKYYVQLITQLWFAPPTIPGYKEKQEGFNSAILNTINRAIIRHTGIVRMIQKELNRHRK